MSKHFSKTTPDSHNIFGVQCEFTVYRGLFGHHPKWLIENNNQYSHNETQGIREGFSTRFWFLIEDGLTEAECDKKVAEYSRQYDHLIDAIENDDKLWNDFPFKNAPVIYHK